MYLNKKKGGNETWIMESKAQRKNNKGTKDDTARNDSQQLDTCDENAFIQLPRVYTAKKTGKKTF